MTDETDPQPAESPTTAGAGVLTGTQDQAPTPSSPEDHLVVEETAIHRRPHSGGRAAHLTDAQYMLLALFLAGLTAIEVAITYIGGLGDAAAPLLIILAVIKFFCVVAFFMHLYVDNPVVRRLFVLGITLALTVYIIVFFTLGVFSSTHGAHL
jgi:heme/copper-type cytochrome/quinol oxidase subunit 4